MEQVATRRNVLAMATVLGLVAAILVYVYLSRTVATTNGNGQVPVVLAKHGIPARTIIAPEMVEMGYKSQKESPDGAITNYQDVVGKVAVAGLAQGNVIRQAEIQEKSVALGLAYTVPEGMRAVTVALDPIIGVAGFLKPGDHVDVLATFNINDGTVTKTVLQDLELLATGSQVFQNKVESKDKPEVAPNATLAVYPSDAERLILAESKGKLRLALRGAGDVMRVQTAGITSRSLIGHVPSDVPEKKVAVASAPAPTYSPAHSYASTQRVPTLPIQPLPLPVMERKEVEVIKGTEVERVPVKT